MKHFFYLTALTALWVVLVLTVTDKGPYWHYLDHVDLYVRAAKLESCQPAGRALEVAVKRCVEAPDPKQCRRVAILAEATRRCVHHSKQ